MDIVLGQIDVFPSQACGCSAAPFGFHQHVHVHSVQPELSVMALMFFLLDLWVFSWLSLIVVFFQVASDSCV